MNGDLSQVWEENCGSTQLRALNHMNLHLLTLLPWYVFSIYIYLRCSTLMNLGTTLFNYKLLVI